MTIREIIEKIEELKEMLAWEKIDNLTGFARERAYIALVSASDTLQENWDDDEEWDDEEE